MRKILMLTAATATLGLALTGCGALEIAAAVQYTLKGPSEITAVKGDTQGTPLTVTVSHMVPGPISAPITLKLKNPPAGVRASDVQVGVMDTSATMNVFVDSTYSGSGTEELVVAGSNGVNSQETPKIRLNVQNP